MAEIFSLLRQIERFEFCQFDKLKNFELKRKTECRLLLSQRNMTFGKRIFNKINPLSLPQHVITIITSR